ncbi:MAG: hypothetical protein HWE16_01230 [Gammaproteobacteria bacterium]|nr:hypothetical protein [Gammaproteobacteria bacterium]
MAQLKAISFTRKQKAGISLLFYNMNSGTRMKLVSTIIAATLLASSNLCSANGLLDIKIPIMEKATEIGNNLNSRFYSQSSNFEIRLNDLDDIAKFYDKSLIKSNWKDPFASNSMLDGLVSPKVWSSYNFSFDSNKPTI